VYPFACQVAEVKVDPDTGQVEVLRITAAHDVGRAINPLATEGQVHGGVTQGMGWALMENMAVEGGKIVNDNMLDYVIPTAMDIPEITPILVEPVDPAGPYGAKGIGEPTLNPVMAAITNAIYNATGIRITKLPVSPEEILDKLGKLDN
jgi:CO/xanthine dehydrogenase Mo-binding subunit